MEVDPKDSASSKGLLGANLASLVLKKGFEGKTPLGSPLSWLVSVPAKHSSVAFAVGPCGPSRAPVGAATLRRGWK